MAKQMHEGLPVSVFDIGKGQQRAAPKHTLADTSTQSLLSIVLCLMCSCTCLSARQYKHTHMLISTLPNKRKAGPACCFVICCQLRDPAINCVGMHCVLQCVSHSLAQVLLLSASLSCCYPILPGYAQQTTRGGWRQKDIAQAGGPTRRAPAVPLPFCSPRKYDGPSNSMAMLQGMPSGSDVMIMSGLSRPSTVVASSCVVYPICRRVLLTSCSLRLVIWPPAHHAALA
jgi:hypothetical protein